MPAATAPASPPVAAAEPAPEPQPIMLICPIGLPPSSSGMMTNGARGLLIASIRPGNTLAIFSTRVELFGVS